MEQKFEVKCKTCGSTGVVPATDEKAVICPTCEGLCRYEVTLDLFTGRRLPPSSIEKVCLRSGKYVSLDEFTRGDY